MKSNRKSKEIETGGSPRRLKPLKQPTKRAKKDQNEILADGSVDDLLKKGAWLITLDDVTNLEQIAKARGIYHLVAPVLENPDFRIWTGSGGSLTHHYGDYQLAKHTYEVVTLCIHSAACLGYDRPEVAGGKEVNMNVLIAAAIWHDYGKLWDYTWVDGSWCKDRAHTRTIHHISRSAIEFSKYAEQIDLEKDLTNRILHCILSHHGRREWGSPVAPLSREAWILHLCDGLSARMNDADTRDEIKSSNP